MKLFVRKGIKRGRTKTKRHWASARPTSAKGATLRTISLAEPDREVDVYTMAMHEEEKDQCFSRRSIIATAPLVPLVGLGAAASAAETAFSPAQLRVIEAFVDRLIPSDENGPGASDSGVATYIDRSFAGALAPERSRFIAGLAAVDEFARNTHHAPFAELAPGKRDQVLTVMESNEAAGFTPDSRTFFHRVRQLTLEGMFGDPFYGGNGGFAGWDDPVPRPASCRCPRRAEAARADQTAAGIGPWNGPWSGPWSTPWPLSCNLSTWR